MLNSQLYKSISKYHCFLICIFSRQSSQKCPNLEVPVTTVNTHMGLLMGFPEELCASPLGVVLQVQCSCRKGIRIFISLFDSEPGRNSDVGV